MSKTICDHIVGIQFLMKLMSFIFALQSLFSPLFPDLLLPLTVHGGDGGGGDDGGG